MTSESWQINFQIAHADATYHAVSPAGDEVAGNLSLSGIGPIDNIIESITGTSVISLTHPLSLKIEVQSQKTKAESLILVVSESLKISESEIAEIIRVPESINKEGRIITHLPERTINKVLRKIYRFNRQTAVVIVLANSWINAIHERILFNLLKTAGYKNLACAHQLNTLFPVLPIISSAFEETLLGYIFEAYRKKLEMKSNREISLKLLIH